MACIICTIGYLILGLVLLFTDGFALLDKVLRYLFLKKKKEYNDPKDTVILCQFPRGPAAPSMSPFPLKLETYLRMANIPYKSVSDRGVSPKGKTPYIMYNGEITSDSQLCIEYLNKKFNTDLDRDLTPEQKGVARAIRKMVEECLYWGLLLYRWTEGGIEAYMKAALQIPWLAFHLVKRQLKKQAEGQGMGRHSRQEVLNMCLGDIQAISDYLGKKPYLMGNKATEVDCAVFGMLVQFQCQLPGSPYETAVKVTYPNLNAYIERMKTEFWKDWDEYHSKEAVK